jgi:hypothetical protein
VSIFHARLAKRVFLLGGAEGQKNFELFLDLQNMISTYAKDFGEKEIALFRQILKKKKVTMARFRV